MAMIFTQTDTTDNNIVNISPFGTTGVDVSKRMAEGATAGSVAGTVSVASSNNGNGTADLNFRTDDGIPNANFAAGNWTVRFNVTTSNMNLTWDGLGISGVRADDLADTSVLTATSLAISCSTTGVKSTTQSGSAISTNTDHVQVSCGFTNGAMSTQTLGVTPSENIDSPLVLPTTFYMPPRPEFVEMRPNR